jgi:glucosamine--fructose-6-phosphate aminotransferase (isomerizing)
VTYILNQLVLFLLAIALGESRAVLTQDQASAFRAELGSLAQAAERTIQSCSRIAHTMAKSWLDENEYVFTGAGPNFGSALFSAAKLLEASGDFALGQDLEEWAHLQYFARKPSTPTFVISAGQRDLSRAVEIIQAAMGIGRQVAAVTPQNVVDMAGGADFWLPLPDGMPEIFSSLVTCLPGALFAAYRAEQHGEPYFRDFSGGRNPEEGGGLSRIQTSRILEELDS